jgi:RNA polymerase sigma-70 factor (ECF subfamily)
VAIPSTHISLLCELGKSGRHDEAWAAFYTRYRNVIFGWCLHRGLRPEDAEDLTQDVLLKLFQQLQHYSHDPARGQFRSWLKTVVNNALIDFWRRQQGQPERGIGGTAFLQWQRSLASTEAATELSGAIEDQARTVATEVLERVRMKVKETTWQAFYQMMVEQRPAVEVAEALTLSVATVYKANYRVRQMLAQEYRHVQAHRDVSDPLPDAGDAGETPA